MKKEKSRSREGTGREGDGDVIIIKTQKKKKDSPLRRVPRVLNPGPLKRLRNDEKALRMFVTRTSKYISTGDKEAIAGILDGMIDKVNRVIDKHDLHPREYLTAISDFQSYVMSVTSVPKTSEIDKRFRNVLRALRKLERTVEKEEIDEERWTEERPKEDREKTKLTIQKGGEEEEMEIQEATEKQIKDSLEMV